MEFQMLHYASTSILRIISTAKIHVFFELEKKPLFFIGVDGYRKGCLSR